MDKMKYGASFHSGVHLDRNVVMIAVKLFP